MSPTVSSTEEDDSNLFLTSLSVGIAGFIFAAIIVIYIITRGIVRCFRRKFLLGNNETVLGQFIVSYYTKVHSCLFESWLKYQ